MIYYKFVVHGGRSRQTYIASASPCLDTEDLEDYVEQMFFIQAANENRDFNPEEDEVEIKITPLDTDQFLYYISDYTKIQLSLSLCCFGNIMDEIVSIYRVWRRDISNDTTYWAFILEGDHVDAPIDYVACKEPDMPFEDVIEEAYSDIMYQVRRYHPQLNGINLHTSYLYYQTITKEEYENQLARVDSYMPY